VFTGHPDTLTTLVRQRHQQLAHEADHARLRHQLHRRRRKT
jgi:hypothetical protein